MEIKPYNNNQVKEILSPNKEKNFNMIQKNLLNQNDTKQRLNKPIFTQIDEQIKRKNSQMILEETEKISRILEE